MTYRLVTLRTEFFLQHNLPRASAPFSVSCFPRHVHRDLALPTSVNFDGYEIVFSGFVPQLLQGGPTISGTEETPQYFVSQF